MSEQAENAPESTATGEPIATEPIANDGEMVAQQQAQEAAVRQSVYEYQEAQRYGSSRVLHAPSYREAEFRSLPRMPGGGRHRHSGGSGRRNTSSTVRYYSESLNSSWQAKADHAVMHDCVPSSWWYRFWQQVGSIVGGRQ